MTELAHDPGGKTRLPLPDGVVGDAYFAGPNDCRRLWLSRSWGRGFPERFALLIGANPSIASALVDDTTLRKDTVFTKRWGYDGFYKVNAMDYRATYPNDLLAPGVTPCGPTNLSVIRGFAARASLIVCCWGELHRQLQPHAVAVERALRDAGHTLHCRHHQGRRAEAYLAPRL